MYAINHAATALLVRKKESKLPLFPLLISVQFVEILWVLFTYLGWEHYSISGGRVHLDYLPYSHSIFSGVAAAAISYCVIAWGYNNRKLALAFAIGVLSHVIIDMVFHEKDIRLSPFSDRPVWGFGIIDYPILNFIVEFAYGILCWWYFKGSKALLWVIIVFNIIDLPIMLAHGSALDPFIHHPFLLPSVILFQILITWYFVFRYARKAKKTGKAQNEQN